MKFYGGNEYPLVPEGERILTITDVTEQTSKKGNEMVLVQLTDMNSGLTMDHHVVFIEEGSRGHGIPKKWLKVLTGSCDGNNDFEPKEWLGKRIKGTVTHEESGQYTNARLDISNYELYELESEVIEPVKDQLLDEKDNIPF